MVYRFFFCKLFLNKEQLGLSAYIKNGFQIYMIFLISFYVRFFVLFETLRLSVSFILWLVYFFRLSTWFSSQHYNWRIQRIMEVLQSFYVLMITTVSLGHFHSSLSNFNFAIESLLMVIGWTNFINCCTNPSRGLNPQ